MPEAVMLNSDEIEILACALAAEVQLDRNWLIRKIKQEVSLNEIADIVQLIRQKEELMIHLNERLMLK